MRWLLLALAGAVSILGYTAEAPASLCGAPVKWAGETSTEVVFTGVSAIEAGARGDGPDEPMPVSLNRDVLGLGEELSLSASGLVARGPAICVRYRPEWMGFELANTGSAAAGGVLRITLANGTHLHVELPQLMPGEVRRMLVMGSEHISLIAADAFQLVPRQ